MSSIELRDGGITMEVKRQNGNNGHLDCLKMRSNTGFSFFISIQEARRFKQLIDNFLIDFPELNFFEKTENN